MAIKATMTWVPARKGWTAWYKGHTHSISCRQLGVPANKAQSVLAANAWWANKRLELDAQAQQTVEVGVDIGDPTQYQRNAEELGKLAREFSHLFGMLEARNLPDHVLREQFTGDRLADLVQDLRAARTVGEQPDREVKQQADAWLAVLRAGVKAGKPSLSRYEAYQRHIGIFVQWVGPQRSVDCLTSAKWLEWYAYLLGQVDERRYSPSYAKTILMTARQWVGWLVDGGIIPAVSRLRSSRLSIEVGPQRIVTCTDEEVRTMLAACDGYSARTKLFLLLMLNCGMYQNDIAQLGVDEVDWQAGTLTRPRSKTPDGPVVNYTLWPETLDLLRRYRAKERVDNERGSTRVLLTERGKPLVDVYDKDGKIKRYDTIQAAYRLVARRAGCATSIKHWRKTGASKLAEHSQYKFYAPYYLAHSPRSVAEKSYVVPSDSEFAAALDWLRSCWL